MRNELKARAAKVLLVELAEELVDAIAAEDYPVVFETTSDISEIHSYLEQLSDGFFNYMSSK